MSTAGAERYDEFVRTRLVGRRVNLWDTIPNLKLHLFKSTAKKTNVKTKDGLVEIKQDINLFNRCVLLCRSRTVLDMREIIGKYELSIVPRSLFHADGSMIHCSDKSKFMHHLVELGQTNFSQQCQSASKESVTSDMSEFDVAIVDGMAEVQIMKTAMVSTVSELAHKFTQQILNKYGMFFEIHIVFDT